MDTKSEKFSKHEESIESDFSRTEPDLEPDLNLDQTLEPKPEPEGQTNPITESEYESQHTVTSRYAEIPEKTLWQLILGSLLEPRETIYYIVNYKRTYLLGLLFYLVGLTVLIDRVFEDGFSLPTLILVVLVAYFVGWIRIHIWGWINGLIGRKLGGIASNEELRLAYVWGKSPLFAYLPFYIFFSFLLSPYVFEYTLSFSTFYVLNVINGLIYFIIDLVTYINLLRMMSELEHFSKWKAFLVTLIPNIILYGLFIGLMGLMMIG